MSQYVIDIIDRGEASQVPARAAAADRIEQTQQKHHRCSQARKDNDNGDATPRDRAAH